MVGNRGERGRHGCKIGREQASRGLGDPQPNYGIGTGQRPSGPVGPSCLSVSFRNFIEWRVPGDSCHLRSGRKVVNASGNSGNWCGGPVGQNAPTWLRRSFGATCAGGGGLSSLARASAPSRSEAAAGLKARLRPCPPGQYALFSPTLRERRARAQPLPISAPRARGIGGEPRKVLTGRVLPAGSLLFSRPGGKLRLRNWYWRRRGIRQLRRVAFAHAHIPGSPGEGGRNPAAAGTCRSARFGVG